MDWPGELWRRLRFLILRRQFERDLDEEMRLHKELRQQEYRREGNDPESARYRAQRQFGNDRLLKEVSREMWGWHSLEILLQDLRYGLRMLAKSPGFTALAVITLALGIGASTTIFSVVNGELFRPLPFKFPDRLVILAEQNVMNTSWRQDPVLSTALSWKKQARSFEQMEFAVGYSETANLILGNEAERVDVQYVSPGLPDMLGIKPALGRGFSAQDHRKNEHYENVLIGHGLWQRHWGGDPNVLGKRLETSAGTFTIIGVMPSNAWYFHG